MEKPLPSVATTTASLEQKNQRDDNPLVAEPHSVRRLRAAAAFELPSRICLLVVSIML